MQEVQHINNMDEKTYNGWSNYATWRINLELVNGYDWSELEDNFTDTYDVSEFIKDMVHTYLDNEAHEDTTKVYDYAMAFISDVNWYEIAESVVESYPSIIKSK